MTEFKVEKEITLNASVRKVWTALTDPGAIKQYLFGTEAVSDWKVGSDLIFQGEYEGTRYQDKGVIQKFEENHVFQYTYLSSFSGLEDKPENYHLITYELKEEGDGTVLTLRHENIQNEEAQNHSGANWDKVLGKIKEITENG